MIYTIEDIKIKEDCYVDYSYQIDFYIKTYEDGNEVIIKDITSDNKEANNYIKENYLKYEQEIIDLCLQESYY